MSRIRLEHERLRCGQKEVLPRGRHEFLDAQRRMLDHGPERFLGTLLAKSIAEINEWQTEIQLKSHSIGRLEFFTSGLRTEDRPLTCVNLVDDLDAAIAAFVARFGDTHVAVILEGHYVIPQYHAAAQPYRQRKRMQIHLDAVGG